MTPALPDFRVLTPLCDLPDETKYVKVLFEQALKEAEEAER